MTFSDYLLFYSKIYEKHLIYIKNYKKKTKNENTKTNRMC